jgi:hypothetical protein
MRLLHLKPRINAAHHGFMRPKLAIVLLLISLAGGVVAQDFDSSRLVKNAISVCAEKHKQETPEFFSCVSRKSLEYYDALAMQEKRLYHKLSQFAYTIDEMDNDFKRDALNEAQFRWLAGLYLMQLVDDVSGERNSKI